MEEKRLFALRGATRCLNTAADIRKQTKAMYAGLLARNDLSEENIVSVIFSVTEDIDAKNPAAALREEGMAAEAALFVTREAYFKGGLERVIRVLIHCYLEVSRSPIHVYRNGAEVLRPERKTNEVF